MAKKSSKATIGASIVLDGEKKFKDAITSCNKSITTMRSELGLIKERYAENANSLEALQAKHSALSKILETQKKKLDETKNGFENAKAAEDRVGKQLDELKAQYSAATAELEKMTASGKASDKELADQQQAVDELSDAVAKGEKTYATATTRVERWQKSLYTAETQTIRADRALKENSRYMEEAERSTDQCATSIDKYGKAINQSAKEAERLNARGTAALDMLAGSIAADKLKDGAREIAAALYDCAEAAEEFEIASKKVSTIADQTKKPMNELNQEMLDLSNSTGTAVTDIAEATYQAISASVDTADAVTTVAAANRLAVAGYSDSTTAVDALTTVINSYGDKVKDAAEVSDVFLTVQNLGKTSVAELGSSIGKVATNAANYNVSIQDLGAAYIEMTKRGVETSEATTYIRAMMKELSKTSTATASVLRQKTGKTFAELMAEGYSLGDVIKVLDDSVSGNATAFQNLFQSQESATAATLLLKTGTEEYNKTLQSVRDSAGATTKAYETMTDTSSHAKDVMLNSIENLKIAIGDELNKSLSDLYEVGGDAFQWASDFVKENPEVVSAIVAVATSLGTLLVVLTGFTVATRIIIPLVREFNTALASNPIGLAAVALSTLVSGVTAYAAVQRSANDTTAEAAAAEREWIEEIKEKREQLQGEVKETQQKLGATEAETATVAKLVGRLQSLNSVQNKTAEQKQEIQNISQQLAESIPEIAAAYDEESGSIDLTNKQLEKLAENYKKTALAAAAQDITAEAAKQALEAEIALTEAQEKREKKQEELAQLEKDNEAAMKAYRDKYGESATRNELMQAANSEEFKQMEKTREAYEEAEKQVADLDMETKEYQKTLDAANKTMNQASEYAEKYAKSTEKNESKTKATVDQYKKVGAAFDEAKAASEKFGQTVASDTEVQFEKIVSAAKKAGVAIPDSLTKGLKDGSKSPETATKELNASVMDGINGMVTEARKLGMNIPENLLTAMTNMQIGVDEGFEKINKKIQTKAENLESKLAANGIAVTKATKRDIEAGGNDALNAIKRMRKQLKDVMQETTDDVAQETKKGGKKSGENFAEGLIDGANSKKGALEMSVSELADAAKSAYDKKMDIHSPSRVMKKSGGHTVDGLIQGMEEKRKDLKKKADELAQDLIDKWQDKIDMRDLRTNGAGYTEAEITKSWKKIVAATKKGTDAHKEALKNYYNARNELQNASKEKLSEYRTSYKDLMKQLKSDIAEQQQTYQDSVASTRDSLMGSYGMFDKATTTKTNDASGLIENLRSQVAQMQKWRENLQKLRDRGISADLISELESMGVASAGDIETLANMTDQQLAEYQGLYSQKGAVAQAEAITQNAPLQTTVNQEIEKLQKQAKAEIAKLKKTYKDQMKDLGKNVSDGFANGIESGNSKVLAAIAKMTGQTVAQVKKNLDIHSPSKVMDKLGGYTGIGFAQGLQRETRDMGDLLTSALPTSVSAPTVNAGASVGAGSTATGTTGTTDTQIFNLYFDGRYVGKAFGRAVYGTVNEMQNTNVSLAGRGMIAYE